MFKYAQLFYFTGTGNTLAVAKAAATALDTQGVSVELTNVLAYTDCDLPGLIGVFLPVYSFGAPRAILRFIKRLPQSEGQAAFVIANAVSAPGSAAHDVGRALAAKGYRVLLADWVAMPSNYILGSEAVDDAQAGDLVSAAQSKVKKLCDVLLAPNAVPPLLKDSRSIFQNLFYWAYTKGLKYAYKFYKYSDKCNGCGACVEMCPTGSITFGNNERPVWKRGCEHCMRCVNLCPQAAIEIGILTKGKRRYKYWQGKVN